MNATPESSIVRDSRMLDWLCPPGPYFQQCNQRMKLSLHSNRVRSPTHKELSSCKVSLIELKLRRVL